MLSYMSTTIVRPADPERASAIRLGLLFAAALFLFHLLANLWEAHLGWGYFRDEFYYIVCGRRLAWGYVDHGPLVAVQARLSEMLFGRSPAGLRLLSGLAGAARVLLTGMLAWALGGRRPAQALAMLGVATTPQYLGTDGYLSMNSFESLFWMGALLVLLRMERSGSPRRWLWFGAISGLGLLNKPSMTFFLLATLGALLLTPQRKLLRTPWLLAALALMLAIVAPYFLWQIHHQFATWQFLRNGQIEGKTIVLSPPRFVLAQLLQMGPQNLLLWGVGLVYLLRRAATRWLGVMFLLFFFGMMLMHAKDYYVAPVYPVLYAGGGLAWAYLFRNSPRVREDRTWAFPVLETVFVLVSVALLPMSTPLLTPGGWVRYATALHLIELKGGNERGNTAVLPQFFADRFGWQEEVDAVTRVFRSLSPEDQKRTVILATNYGEAGALDFLGRGLPPARSGHNNYWLWGPGERPGEVVILIEDTTAEHLQQYFDSVQEVGTMDNSEWEMPWEKDASIWLLRGPHQSLQQLWPEKKNYL